MDLSNLVSLLLGIGGVAVATMAGLSFGSRKALREANADLRDRITDLEKSDALKTAQIAELNSDNKVLRSMVTGEVHWRALAEEQTQFIRDAHRHWNKESAALDKVLECLDKVVTKMNRAAP